MSKKIFKRLGQVASNSIHTFSVAALHPLASTSRRIKEREAPLENLRQLSKSTPVVFVHGVLHNPTAFYRYLNEAKKRSYSYTHCMDLKTSFKNFEELSSDLSQKLRHLTENSSILHHSNRIYIVAHSLGGLLLRQALTDSRLAEKVAKVVFLGVPHGGSPRLPLFFPKVLRELNRSSAAMKRIQQSPLPPNIDYLNLRGEIDWVTPRQNTFLDHVPNVVFPGVGHVGLLSNKLVIRHAFDFLSIQPESQFSLAANRVSV